MAFWITVITVILIYYIVAVALNLIAGYTGMVTMSQAAFFGVGAYCAALLGANYNLDLTVIVIISFSMGAGGAYLLGLVSARTKDDTFTITTFGFQIVISGIFNNWQSLTGGPFGMSVEVPPSVFGNQLVQDTSILWLVLTFAVLLFFANWILSRAIVMRRLLAVRDGELLANICGMNSTKIRVLVFAIGSGLLTVAGVIYAYHVRQLDPPSFSVSESIMMLSIVIIGGAASLFGPIIGALFVMGTPELLRFLGVPSSTAALVNQMLYGCILTLFMLWRPQGLVGKYSFHTT